MVGKAPFCSGTWRPEVLNWLLCAGCLVLIFTFQSSSNLAAAYGLAVSGVMFSTSLTMIPLAVLRWHWGIVQASLLFGGFAAIEVMFLLANTLIFAEGGFAPLLIGGGLFVAMSNYHWGRIELLASAYAAFATRRDMCWPLDLKQRLMDHSGVLRDNQRDLKEAERTDVFMTSRPVTQKTDGVPVTGACLAVRFIKKENVWARNNARHVSRRSACSSSVR
jgi:K+ transporter